MGRERVEEGEERRAVEVGRREAGEQLRRGRGSRKAEGRTGRAEQLLERPMRMKRWEVEAAERRGRTREEGGRQRKKERGREGELTEAVEVATGRRSEEAAQVSGRLAVQC